jgi:glycine/D-amino acid oxidase-like deaminating enzyme/nitrite reductase/ring-hydroxylating ferredoxin subunit
MNTPYWQDSSEPTSYPALDREIEVDALVIGAGITGVTTAYLLRKNGLRVALCERGKIGSGESSHTTAHLTYMTDTRLSDLLATFGEEKTRLAWEAGRDTLEFIEKTVSELGIECDLKVVPGYLAAEEGDHRDAERAALQREANAAAKLGFSVRYMESAPPDSRPAIEFAHQLKFHPQRYIQGLAAKAHEQGAQIFENTSVEIEEQGRASANGVNIRYKSVVIATHVPLQGSKGTVGAALFQTKLAGYSTYAIRAKVPDRGQDELIWSDTQDPFLYLRVDREADGLFMILGGEDHKTGQETDTEAAFQNLEKAMRKFSPEFEVTHRWSGQVIETIDGLPYIGMDGSGQYIATGFSGNGYTFGTLTALMATDALMGIENRYYDLFDPDRKTFSAIASYMSENKDFPIRLVTDRMGHLPEDPDELENGCGKIMKWKGSRCAVFRDDEGHLHPLSAVCPHMGCVVAWNQAEQTWDCPCHGSRFTATGGLIAGPAEEGLKPAETED